MATKTKTLVVDASVGCAAINENSVSPTAISCIELLRVIYDRRFNIAISEEIENEWLAVQRIGNAYANKWLLLMENRELVAALHDTADAELRENIANSTHNPSTRAAMRKDVHLLEAALATDKIILSRDKKCRKYFRQAASVVAKIKPILWANPEQPEDDAVGWLNNGAPNEKKRQLGS